MSVLVRYSPVDVSALPRCSPVDMSVLPRNTTVDVSCMCTCDDDEEEGLSICKIKLSELRTHLDDLITFMDSSSDHEVEPYDSHFRAFRDIIIRNFQNTIEIGCFLEAD
jgi:hypothetical protein